MIDKYTIEQIEAAIQAVRNGKLCIPEKIIDELTKPVWKPQLMSNYSIEQINAVFSGENDHLTCKELREKLTRSQWKPQVGEVYLQTTHYKDEECLYIKSDGNDLIKYGNQTNRPLTPDEVPALKVAIEALDKLADSSYCTDVANEITARDTLAKINKMTATNEDMK